MMMLLKTSPVENVVCTCVAEDCDAQGVEQMLRKGNLISDAAAVVRPGLCKLNVVLIWSIGGHRAVDSPESAAAATMTSPSTSACLCPQQRQLKGT